MATRQVEILERLKTIHWMCQHDDLVRMISALRNQILDNTGTAFDGANYTRWSQFENDVSLNTIQTCQNVSSEERVSILICIWKNPDSFDSKISNSW